MDAVRGRNDRDVVIFGAALACAFLSKGLALVPGYAFDDYFGTYVDQPLELYLAQGRYTAALLQCVLAYAGLTTTDIAWVSVSLCIFALAGVASHAASRMARSDTPLIFVVSWIGLICAYPYFTEYFTFRQATYVTTFNLVFILAHLRAVSRLDLSAHALDPGNRRDFCLAVFWLLLALGGNQIMLAIAVGVIYAIVLCSDEFERNTLRGQVLLVYRALLPALVATLCYALIFLALKACTPDGLDRRATLITVLDVPERLHQLAHLANKMFGQGEPTVSGLAKVLLAIGAASVFSMALVRRRRLAIFWVIGLLGGIVLTVLPLALSSDWWPVPRTVSALGFVLGASAGALTVIARVKKEIIALPWLAAAIIFSFNSAAMLEQQQRLNRWDLNKAQLVVHDIQVRYGTSPAMPVVVGYEAGLYRGMLSTSDGDLNSSAFARVWAQEGLLAEGSGSRIKVDTMHRNARQMCATRPHWPAQDAIFDAFGLIYVCL